jgi:hypothetical protein
LNLFPDYSQNRKTLKESPEVFLKDDYENKEENREKPLKYNGGKIKLEKFCNNIDKTKEADAQ